MDLEALDNALKASWQSVAMNMNMVRLLLITRGPSEDTRALLSRSETMMQQLMQVKGLTADTYALGYLRPGNDMTVCRVEALPHRQSADVGNQITTTNDNFGGAKWRRFVYDAKKTRPSSSYPAWRMGK